MCPECDEELIGIGDDDSMLAKGERAALLRKVEEANERVREMAWEVNAMRHKVDVIKRHLPPLAMPETAVLERATSVKDKELQFWTPG